ncbi:MAG: hypothetical protein NC489_44225 [Ruminococcus flavefaciens]|nr:hypothetical protein [Ruminococcus flavefaciens]
MNKKQKKEWIIKYVKNNDMEYILHNKYKTQKSKWLKVHSDEIQSICSIISVLIVGIISLILTMHYNTMVKEQTKLMEIGQKPIIDIVINEDVADGTDELTIINRGAPCLSYGIEVISYLDVLCYENGWGIYL